MSATGFITGPGAPVTVTSSNQYVSLVDLLAALILISKVPPLKAEAVNAPMPPPHRYPNCTQGPPSMRYSKIIWSWPSVMQEGKSGGLQGIQPKYGPPGTHSKAPIEPYRTDMPTLQRFEMSIAPVCQYPSLSPPVRVGQQLPSISCTSKRPFRTPANETAVPSQSIKLCDQPGAGGAPEKFSNQIWACNVLFATQHIVIAHNSIVYL